MAKIAWIGLGHMGGPMARRLSSAGHEVRGFDISHGSVDAAVAGGVIAAASVAEAVRNASVVFTSLPAGKHVRSVLEGEGGVWDNARSDTLIADVSTVDIETSRWCHRESERRSFRFVDAPVSGGVSGAESGRLTFMMGGSEKDVKDLLPIIEPLSGNRFAMGGAGMGVAAKLANNLMALVNMVAVAEGASLAAALGLDSKSFWDVARVSSGDSWVLRTWYPIAGVVDSAASNRDFDAVFSADLAAKDLSLALEAGESARLTMEAARLALSSYERLSGEGLGAKDCSQVIRLVGAADHGGSSPT